MNATKSTIFQFFMHLTRFVVAILVKSYCFTSPSVPRLEAKSVIPSILFQLFMHLTRFVVAILVFKILLFYQPICAEAWSQISDSIVDHQRQWALLMVLIIVTFETWPLVWIVALQSKCLRLNDFMTCTWLWRHLPLYVQSLWSAFCIFCQPEAASYEVINQK